MLFAKKRTQYKFLSTENGVICDSDCFPSIKGIQKTTNFIQFSSDSCLKFFCLLDEPHPPTEPASAFRTKDILTSKTPDMSGAYIG